MIASKSKKVKGEKVSDFNCIVLFATPQSTRERGAQRMFKLRLFGFFIFLFVQAWQGLEKVRSSTITERKLRTGRWTSLLPIIDMAYNVVQIVQTVTGVEIGFP